MKQDSLLCHGHGADQVFGDLDEDVSGPKGYLLISLSKPVVELATTGGD